MKSNFRLIIFTLLAFYASVSAQQIVTLDFCVSTALKNNPQMRLSEGSYESAGANLISNRAVLFPQLSFQSGFSRTGGTSFIGPTARTIDYSNYSYGFQATQLLFDSWKTYSRVSAYSSLADAARADAQSQTQILILNTQTAFYAFRQASRIREAAGEMQKQAQEHLKQAKAFYDAGKKPLFDVLKGESDLANANVNLLKATNTERTAKLQLENLLNIKFTGDTQFQDDLTISADAADTVPGVDEAMIIASKNRPELAAALARVSANEQLIQSAWSANLPALAASGGYTWRTMDLNTKFVSGWNVGLTFSLPLFQGFGLQAGIDQAKANFKIASAQYDMTIQAVRLEVEQQVLNLNESAERIKASDAFLRQAEETLKLAEARYKQEVGSPVEITDAQITLLNARIAVIQSIYDYKIAMARYLKAVGTLK